MRVSKTEIRAPIERELTSLANATVSLDGAGLADRGNALLAQKKRDPRPNPDDCSKTDEELTHLFIGDRTACIAAAHKMAAASGGQLFDPACGRSGRNVQVIRCAPDGSQTPPIPFEAIACDFSSLRDTNDVLGVSSVLLTNEKDSTKWTDTFRRSYRANCTADDPRGRKAPLSQQSQRPDDEVGYAPDRT